MEVIVQRHEIHGLLRICEQGVRTGGNSILSGTQNPEIQIHQLICIFPELRHHRLIALFYHGLEQSVVFRVCPCHMPLQEPLQPYIARTTLVLLAWVLLLCIIPLHRRLVLLVFPVCIVLYGRVNAHDPVRPSQSFSLILAPCYQTIRHLLGLGVLAVPGQDIVAEVYLPLGPLLPGLLPKRPTSGAGVEVVHLLGGLHIGILTRWNISWAWISSSV